MKRVFLGILESVICMGGYAQSILHPVFPSPDEQLLARTECAKVLSEYTVPGAKLLSTEGKQDREIRKALVFAEAQLAYTLKCVEEVKAKTPDKKMVSPRSIEKDGRLRMVAARDWCSGFFPGTLWQMYHYTQKQFWREAAVSYTWPLEELKNYTRTHDLGFMMYCSFGQAYRLTGEQSYKDVAVQAAKSLSSRYHSKLKVIRSWDWHGKKWQYPVIIDNMMNLELLFWATQVTGDSSYYKIAVNHANSTLENHFRPDGSSWHVVDYDTVTGKVRLKCTHQGISDESVWSRGQGWGLYGFTMCYRFTKNPAYLRQAEKIADYFFSLPDLPDDYVPYWDMKDPARPACPRDASAAALMASALYELSEYVSADKAVKYRDIADEILHNLYTYYRTEPGTNYGFLLLHSTGNYPSRDEIDVPISYADYYYLEALLRKTGAAR